MAPAPCPLFFFPNLLFHSPVRSAADYITITTEHRALVIHSLARSLTHSPFTTQSLYLVPHLPLPRPEKHLKRPYSLSSTAARQRDIAGCETTVAPFLPAARPSVLSGPRSKIPGLPVPCVAALSDRPQNNLGQALPSFLGRLPTRARPRASQFFCDELAFLAFPVQTHTTISSDLVFSPSNKPLLLAALTQSSNLSVIGRQLSRTVWQTFPHPRPLSAASIRRLATLLTVRRNTHKALDP